MLFYMLSCKLEWGQKRKRRKDNSERYKRFWRTTNIIIRVLLALEKCCKFQVQIYPKKKIIMKLFIVACLIAAVSIYAIWT